MMVMHAAPPIVDPARLAREESRLTGVLSTRSAAETGRCPLLTTKVAVSYEVRRVHHRRMGSLPLRINLEADLGLRCQRCLQRPSLHLDVERDIVLVADMRELDPGDDEDDDTDAIQAYALVSICAS